MMMNTFYRQSSIGLLAGNNEANSNPAQVVGMGGTFYGGFGGSQSSLGLKSRKNVLRNSQEASNTDHISFSSKIKMQN